MRYAAFDSHARRRLRRRRAHRERSAGQEGPRHGLRPARHADETTGSTSVAKGHTTIKVRRDGTIEFKTKILNRSHETFIAGHVHLAPVGVAGPIVVPLYGPPSPATSARQIKQHGVATPNAGTTGAALCQNPAAYYVNYHTTAFTGGAIRGQLR